ncbi:MAG: type III secretion system chaperone [Kiritimatiellae bacterium]|nr:type III secretion system chaperone [Kiritimatiellia bacterium]
MTFKEYVDLLAKELGAEIETAGDACAFAFGAKEGGDVSVLLQGFDERGMMLTCADLGEPPPEGLEQLYRTLLEANDLYGDTGGATLSINRQTGHVRLQRFDDMDTLAAIGPAKALVAFADTAVAWKRLIADFRDAGGQPSPTAATAREEACPPSDAMLV